MTDTIRTAILETIGDRLAPADVDALAVEIHSLLKAETLRCARLCRDRAELWRTTQLSKSDIPSAREEARARANEAKYLADLLAV